MSTGGREITRPAGNYFENKLLLNPEKWALNIYLKEKKGKCTSSLFIIGIFLGNYEGDHTEDLATTVQGKKSSCEVHHNDHLKNNNQNSTWDINNQLSRLILLTWSLYVTVK